MAEAIHAAVRDTGLDSPILVGHSIGGPLAAIYAAAYPAAAVLSIDAPIRLETFAQLLGSLRAQLEGDGFAAAWSMFQACGGIRFINAGSAGLGFLKIRLLGR